MLDNMHVSEVILSAVCYPGRSWFLFRGFSEDGKSQWFIWRVLIISVLWFDAEKKKKKKKEKEEEAQQELYFVTVYP